ncbi:MAG TPA: hypothetical protein VK272_11170 [Solirubrobacteraceae bacterium]|nr:hypothetical protein [Solirubrobacteraceae bacterium]
MATTSPKIVKVAKRRFELGHDAVEQKMQGRRPEPIASHFVVIGVRRFPPKQVICAMTGLDRADFTSHQARRILTGLGFAAGRQPRDEPAAHNSEPPAHLDRDTGSETSRTATASMRPSAEELEPFIGQWVATRGPQVLVAAGDPRTVVSWLAEHRQRADSMFRVPETEYQASGLAPR